MLMTPKNKPAEDMDRVMLLAIWTKQRANELKDVQVISAGMGKPSFPLNEAAAKTATDYWQNLHAKTRAAQLLLDADVVETSLGRDAAAKSRTVVDYGNPMGELDAREQMAAALNHWYQSAITITEENILFTVGGAGALYCVFEVINRLHPQGRIVTPFPHYSLYVGAHKKNRLYPIHVMENKGYQLTAKALENAINEANALGKIDGGTVSAFLFSDPSNPLGNFVSEEELRKMIPIFQKHPEIYIIVDGAYEEMRLDGKKHLSLLSVAPSELRNQLIVIRSGTKALSLAGERMAVLIAFNDTLMNKLLQQHIVTLGHAPISLQYAFAAALSQLDEMELSRFVDFYKPQITYVMHRLKNMDAVLPDMTYATTASFYVLADLSDLLGMAMPEALSCVFPYIKGLDNAPCTKTDEEIIYTLLFQDNIMLCPCSYFGLDPKKGYVRITCSGGDIEMKLLMDRLEYRITRTRQAIQKDLLHKINEMQDQLFKNKANQNYCDDLNRKIDHLLTTHYCAETITAKQLKKINYQLKNLLSDITILCRRQSEPEKLKAVVTLQAFFRGCNARRTVKSLKNERQAQWITLVNDNLKDCKMRKEFYSFLPSQRLDFKPWRDYLKTSVTDERLTHPKLHSLKPKL